MEICLGEIGKARVGVEVRGGVAGGLDHAACGDAADDLVGEGRGGGDGVGEDAAEEVVQFFFAHAEGLDPG